MKNKQTLLFIILLLVGINSAKAQKLLFGGTGSIALSKVTYDLSKKYCKSKYAPTTNLGVFLEMQISQKSFLGVEALWIPVRGSMTCHSNINDSEIVGEFSNTKILYLNYIGMPIYYRLKMGALGIKVGCQPMVVLSRSLTSEIIMQFYGDPFELKYEDKNKELPLHKLNIGPKIGLDYRLSSKIRLRMDYYLGLIDIQPKTDDLQQRNRQLNIGIQYTFSKFE